MQNKISIITPVYNVSEYLPRCIDSILDQTYKNLEIILVNDDYTDASKKICDEYSYKDQRIKVLYKENDIISDVRNTGMKASTGKYVAFIDSNDYIENDMYETLLKTIYDYDADIVQFALYRINENNKIIPKHYSGKAEQFDATSAMEELISKRRFNNNVCNKIYKKDLLQGIWFPLNMKHSEEETVFNYKVFAKAKKIVYMDIPKYYFTYRKDSITVSKSHLKTIDQVNIYLERLEFISKDFPSLFNLAQKDYYFYLLKIYGNLKNNPHFDKDKKQHNLIKNYINKNYRSFASNPLINRKHKVLLKIFKINFELGYLFFDHYLDLVKFREYYSLLPFGYLRVQKLVTRILNPQYQRSRKFIEIDITYACNLKCYNCDRSCSQAPSRERMTVAQIRQFLDESIAGNIHWERIRILGGEPTLHPNLLEIIDMINNWRLEYAPDALIELNTNGYGSNIRKVLRIIPDDIIIKNSNKNSREQLFDSFNIAPFDKIAYRFADFRNGCYLAKMSGIGLTPYGYYPCAPAGAIDRVFGFDIGRDKLPTENDDLYDQLKKFCCFCGHFERRFHFKVHHPIMSKTWKNAYELYTIKRPILHRYGEKI